MKFKGVIFDLDGTLVNSLEDIADAMNTVLKSYNYPTHSYETYQYFIGSGLRNLVSKALPTAYNDSKHIDHCYQLMIDEYSVNCTHKTKPYVGIYELLDFLISQNIKLGVFSNKSDELTKKVVDDLFSGYFEAVSGLTVEELKKPNPSGAIEIANKFGFDTKEMLFVGDSGIDMQTATNANMMAVGVSWGYRPEKELMANGAKHVLSNPLDLISILQSKENILT